MAVRNDFTAGEVLAAADLNDTFASKLPYSYGTATPSTTDSGFLWYDSNSTPAAPKFWNGSAFVDFPSGMSIVASDTFSSVSSISLNGCFTSAYENYEMMISGSMSATTFLSFRLRASGSDASGGDYTFQLLDAAAATPSSSGATGQTLGRLGFNDASRFFTVTSINNPALPDTTYLQTQCNRSGTTTRLTVAHTFHNLSTAYDGITIFPSSGTFSGTIRVYGYKD